MQGRTNLLSSKSVITEKQNCMLCLKRIIDIDTELDLSGLNFNDK